MIIRILHNVDIVFKIFGTFYRVLIIFIFWDMYKFSIHTKMCNKVCRILNVSASY